MVSKRNFFSIAIMMFVLLFLFQFSMVIRDRQNTYDINSNLTAREVDGKDAWQKQQLDMDSLTQTDRKYVLFVGNASGEMADVFVSYDTVAWKSQYGTRSNRENSSNAP